MRKHPHNVIKDVASIAKEFYELVTSTPGKHPQGMAVSGLQHAFCHWLHKQEHFKKAKTRAHKANLPIHGVELEYICAWTITHFFNRTDNFYKSVVARIKKKQLAIRKMKLTLAALRKGSYFENESKQHLAMKMLSDLIKDESGRNIASSGRIHHNLKRDLFLKKLISSLYSLFGTSLKPTPVAYISLELVGLFFESTLDEADARRLAKKIQIAVKDELAFNYSPSHSVFNKDPRVQSLARHRHTVIVMPPEIGQDLNDILLEDK